MPALAAARALCVPQQSRRPADCWASPAEPGPTGRRTGNGC